MWAALENLNRAGKLEPLAFTGKLAIDGFPHLVDVVEKSPHAGSGEAEGRTKQRASTGTSSSEGER